MLKIMFILLILCNVSYLSATATKQGNYYVITEKLNVRLAPHKNGKKTNILYKNQKVQVYEVLNGWARISYYYLSKKEGISYSIARWVSSKYLLKTKVKTKNNNNSLIVQALKGTDNFVKYQAIFISASEKLVKNKKCSISDFKEMGGWMRSSSKRNIYFTYCGGMSKSNRLYLNISTGKVYK